jgi:hypothetical protein
VARLLPSARQPRGGEATRQWRVVALLPSPAPVKGRRERGAARAGAARVDGERGGGGLVGRRRRTDRGKERDAGVGQGDG